MTLLMPDPKEAQFYGLTENHAEYRVWGAVNVMGLPVPKRRTSRNKPTPGVLDIAEEEAG